MSRSPTARRGTDSARRARVPIRITGSHGSRPTARAAPISLRSDTRPSCTPISAGPSICSRRCSTSSAISRPTPRRARSRQLKAPSRESEQKPRPPVVQSVVRRARWTDARQAALLHVERLRWVFGLDAVLLSQADQQDECPPTRAGLVPSCAGSERKLRLQPVIVDGVMYVLGAANAIV